MWGGLCPTRARLCCVYAACSLHPDTAPSSPGETPPVPTAAESGKSHPLRPPGLLFENFKANPGFRSFKQQTLDMPIVTLQPSNILHPSRWHGESCMVPLLLHHLQVPFPLRSHILPQPRLCLPSHATHYRNRSQSHVHNPARGSLGTEERPQRLSETAQSPKCHQSAGQGTASAHQQQTITKK